MTEQIKNEFRRRDAHQLSLDLIEAQYQHRARRGSPQGKSLLILVSGIELAGKGEAVKQLREWVDPRYLQVKADVPNVLCATQSFWQPYARYIPAQGQITILFGNWYSDLFSTSLHVSEPINKEKFKDYVAKMRAFEHDLQQNNVQIIKFWFDLSWAELQHRLDGLDPTEQQWQQLHGLDWRNHKQYEAIQSLRQQCTQDWFVINGNDAKKRNQRFAHCILSALKQPWGEPSPKQPSGRWQKAKVPDKLRHFQQDALEKADYKAALKKLSKKVAQALRQEQRKVVIVFEGMDAAGKGGAIKRIVRKLDPREYEIHSIAAPEKYELRRPYLWRFWNKLPTNSGVTIFDRSWYGRVLVERLEGFAKLPEWKRAYAEINRFEQDLVDCQTVVIKFWLAISKDEQEQRFMARQNTPHKRFKITDEDWRNRDKWDAYLQAAADTFAQTSTEHAPWHIIASNDKYTARLHVLQHILRQLKQAVKAGS